MKNRIRKLINIKANGNLSAFAQKCGVSAQTIINAVKQDTCSCKTAAAILSTFPDINAHWLITGDGDITRPFGLAYAENIFLHNILKTLNLAVLVPKMSAEQVNRFQIATAQGKVPEFSDEEIESIKKL